MDAKGAETSPGPKHPVKFRPISNLNNINLKESVLTVKATLLKLLLPLGSTTSLLITFVGLSYRMVQFSFSQCEC